MAITWKGNILIIDDNPDITDIIAFTLNKLKYQTIVSFNMEDALDNFQKMQYDLIISDIFMDGMGGIEGIGQIRTIDSEAKIIAISGGFADMPPDQALKAATQTGADAVMTKPFDIAELGELVSSLLGGSA